MVAACLTGCGCVAERSRLFSLGTADLCYFYRRYRVWWPVHTATVKFELLGPCNTLLPLHVIGECFAADLVPVSESTLIRPTVRSPQTFHVPLRAARLFVSFCERTCTAGRNNLSTRATSRIQYLSSKVQFTHTTIVHFSLRHRRHKPICATGASKSPSSRNLGRRPGLGRDERRIAQPSTSSYGAFTGFRRMAPAASRATACLTNDPTNYDIVSGSCFKLSCLQLEVPKYVLVMLQYLWRRQQDRALTG